MRAFLAYCLTTCQTTFSVKPVPHTVPARVHVPELTPNEDFNDRPGCSPVEQARNFRVCFYYDNYLIENRTCVIAGVVATPARLSQEIIAAQQMLERAKERFGLQPLASLLTRAIDGRAACPNTFDSRLRLQVFHHAFLL